MKYLIFALVSFSSLVYSNPKISLSTPEFDGTKLIFSTDMSLYRNTQYLNPSLQYYTSNYSVGIQAVNIRLGGDQMQNFESDTYLNAAKKFNINSIYSVEIGGMAGTNLNNRSQQLHASAYFDNNFVVTENLAIGIGSYYVNDVLATIHQPFNAHAGIKYKMNDFTLVGDYFSGNNNLSGAVVNLFYKLTPSLRPYIGVQVPEKNSGNEFAGTVGFSVKLN
jgi:hypothetical protein